jgi:hypothetical protein
MADTSDANSAGAGRNEMQLDPAPRPSELFLHRLGVMIARVLEKDMEERQGLDRWIVETASTVMTSIIRLCRAVDRAVNIDPLAPARLFCPAAPYGTGRLRSPCSIDSLFHVSPHSYRP